MSDSIHIGSPLSCVVCRRPHSLNTFFCETTWLIKVKFHMEPLWNEEINVNTNGLCHLTKMAAMPIYDKDHLKSSFLEPKGR